MMNDKATETSGTADAGGQNKRMVMLQNAIRKHRETIEDTSYTLSRLDLNSDDLHSKMEVVCDNLDEQIEDLADIYRGLR